MMGLSLRFMVVTLVLFWAWTLETTHVAAFTVTRSSSLFSKRRAVLTLKRGNQQQPAVTPNKLGEDPRKGTFDSSSLWRSPSHNSYTDDGIGPRKRQWFGKLRRRLRNFLVRSTLLFLAVTTTLQALFPFGGGGTSLFRPEPAEASAPIVALPKSEDLDPGKEALMRHEKAMVQRAQHELDVMAQKARAIEAAEGPTARNKFEKEYKANEQIKAEKKAQGFVQLKRDLLDQGIDPFCDIEGQRQVILYEKGLDLGEVSGTPFNVEQVHQMRSPKKSFMVRKAPNREVIKLMVQDLKSRDMDPLEYFEARKDQTMAILEMPAPKAVSMVEMYRANMEEYGQITKPQPGELSVKEKKQLALEKQMADPKAQAKIAKQQKAEAKAKAKAQRERAKAEAKAEKERQKVEAKAAKEEAKLKAEKEKEAAAASAAAAATAVGVGSAVTATAGAAEAVGTAASNALPSPSETIVSSSTESTIAGEESSAVMVEAAPTPDVIDSSSSGQLQQKFTKIIPASAVVVGIGAGAYGLNVYRKRAAEEEEERQRQFRMLMQGNQPDPEDEPELMDADSDTMTSSVDVSAPAAPVPQPTPAPAPAAPPKKRRLGIFKSKKGSGRETDLSVLVAEDAQAPEFAILLGKILTFGAPGRFPQSQSVLGSDLPMDKFDLETAKDMLVKARLEADLEVTQSAEIFANVVNCMLIEIMDLASSSLKEKEAKKTMDAVNIVVDFMNHAASLYDAVAEGATIAPVTYNGSLSRSKLEQMYSQYAVGGMMNMDSVADDFDARVALLQDVFSINEKKAEGLMMKAMQKNMAEMMKNGGEGMEDFMKNMAPGMEDMLGGEGGEGIDPEQLKAMLREFKAAKDRGEYSKEELEKVRSSFKEIFGSSLEEVFNGSAETEEDQEVMDLMKAVLYD